MSVHCALWYTQRLSLVWLGTVGADISHSQRQSVYSFERMRHASSVLRCLEMMSFMV